MSYIKNMTNEQIKNKIIGQTYSKELLDTYDWEGYYPYVKFYEKHDGGEIAVITDVLDMRDVWNPAGCTEFVVIDADNEYARNATYEEIAYHETYGDWPKTIMR